MHWSRNVAKVVRSQRGFTVAEVLIAVFILSTSSLGLLSVFNGALQLSSASTIAKDAQRFAANVDEQLRTVHFYVPYSAAVGNQDFDDSYYCTVASPRSPMTVNNWSTAPEVPYTAVVDPRFTVTMKMVYVNDDLGEDPMATGFGNGPIAPLSGGSDKPMSDANKPFHMIKYQIRVTWKFNNTMTANTFYTYMGLMTDTQFTANLGVSSMINTSADATKKGTIIAAGGTDCISAPNNASSIDVRIVGFGFKEGAPLSGSLVWPKPGGPDDIDFDSLTRDTDTECHGQITLNSGWSGTGGPPRWNPRRDPGKWAVRINVGTGYALLYDGFTVQFPQPIRVTDGTSVSPRSGTNSTSNLAITCTGSNVLNLGTGLSPYTDYAGATIRLVSQDNPAAIVTVTGGTLSYTGDSYGAGTDSVTGQFDVRGKEPGVYWVEAWNCKNRNSPCLDENGDARSPHDANMTIELIQVNPHPLDMYVTGSDGSQVYVASGEKRHFAFRNRDYKYTIRIDGADMGSVTLARLGTGGVAADGTGTRTVDATNVVADNNSVTATFDLKSVEDTYARSDDTYDWWIYVQNSSTTGASGSLENIFQVRKPRPILYRDAEYVSGGGGGINHNYSGVVVRLTGECFDSSTYNIKYDSGTYAWGSTTYTVGSSDGGMAKGDPANHYTRWDTTLNLIHCRNTSNNIRVLMVDGTTDNNFTSTKESPSRTYKFYVPVGTTNNSTLKDQTLSTTSANSAVYIYNSFKDWYWSTWHYVSTWRYGANCETTSVLAKAQRTVGHVAGDQSGQAQFTLRGQGFKDAIVGTSPVQLLRWYTDGWGHWWWEELCGQDNVSVANPASEAAALTDRTNLFVSVGLLNHEMPKETQNGEINLGSNSYPNRFSLQEVLLNN